MFRTVLSSVGALTARIVPRTVQALTRDVPQTTLPLCRHHSLQGTSFQNSVVCRTARGRQPSASHHIPLLQPATPVMSHIQTYKVKSALSKRCKHCYFVKRQGRMFIECKAKPRHKQMQRMSKWKLFRED